MTPHDPQEIEERFQRLPESLKDAMLSVENSERIFEVGKKCALNVEQIGFLAEETGYVVLGLTHPKNFVTRLSQHLHVDNIKAKTIAQAINHQIFFPLREVLKSTHQFELTQEQIQEPTMPIPSPISRPQTPPSAPVSKPNTLPPTTLRDASKHSGAAATAPIIPLTPTPIKPPLPPVPSAPIVKTPLAPTPQPIPSVSPAQPNQKPITPTPPAPPTPSPTKSPPLSSFPPPSIATQPPAQPSTQTPAQRPPLPSLSSLPPSTIQEKKSEVPISPLPPITSPKSVEGIKTKDVSSAATVKTQTPATQTPASENPLAPSQMMQKKLLDERQYASSAPKSEVERIKESMFAPASVPNTSTQTITPTPVPTPASPPPVSETLPQPSNPTSYSGNDPYREPLE